MDETYRRVTVCHPILEYNHVLLMRMRWRNPGMPWPFWTTARKRIGEPFTIWEFVCPDTLPPLNPPPPKPPRNPPPSTSTTSVVDTTENKPPGGETANDAPDTQLPDEHGLYLAPADFLQRLVASKEIIPQSDGKSAFPPGSVPLAPGLPDTEIGRFLSSLMVTAPTAPLSTAEPPPLPDLPEPGHTEPTTGDAASQRPTRPDFLPSAAGSDWDAEPPPDTEITTVWDDDIPDATQKWDNPPMSTQVGDPPRPQTPMPPVSWSASRPLADPAVTPKPPEMPPPPPIPAEFVTGNESQRGKPRPAEVPDVVAVPPQVKVVVASPPPPEQPPPHRHRLTLHRLHKVTMQRRSGPDRLTGESRRGGRVPVKSSCGDTGSMQTPGESPSGTWR
jgi:hypothetical protein